MADRMRSFDWPSSALGPVEEWPTSLRTAVGICLSSRHPMVIWWGPQLVLLYNDAWVPVLGPDKHPALGLRGAEVWPEVWHIIGEQLNSVLATGTATWSNDQLLPAMRHGYLEEAYFTYSYSAIHNECGEVAGVFTAVTETTARVLGERRLRALRALGEVSSLHTATVEQVCSATLATLAAHRADIPFAGIYLADDSGTSATLVATMGLRAGSESLPPILTQATASSPLWSALRTGNAEMLSRLAPSIEGSVLPGASLVGERRPENAVALPILVAGPKIPVGLLVVAITPYREFDEDYRGFLELVRDRVAGAVSAARASAEQHRRVEALAELDRAKSEFFANVSHELRTPLTLIAAPAEDALADRAEPLGTVQRERVLIIRRNAGRLRRLVDELLAFSRIEAGRMQPEVAYLDLASATSELVASFAPAAAHAGLAMVLDATPLSQPALVDVAMWEKIVLNLLSNAVKYTLAGEVRISLRDDGVTAKLEVRDTGIGIPASDLERIFERFHRVRHTPGRSHEGSGIGLALVSELVRLHGGTVRVESEVGVGSVFTVSLPFSAAATAGPTSAGPTSVVADPPAEGAAQTYLDEALSWTDPEPGPSPETATVPGSACVLVVEDNADLRHFITRLLAPHWRVVQAADGHTALKAVREHRPDLVLTDVMMPGMDGFELLAALRADPVTAATAVVMLSARSGQDAAVEGLEAGVDDYLLKPFSAAELLARVRSNLELAQFRNRESQLRRAMVDSLQEGFFVSDHEGTLTEANAAFLALTGYESAVLPLHWPPPWVPGKAADPLYHQLHSEARAAYERDGSGKFTLPFIHRDGHEVWAVCTSARVRDPISGNWLYVGTARDVTAERRAHHRESTLARFAAALAVPRESTDVLATALNELRTITGARMAVAAQWHGNDASPTLTAPDRAAPLWDQLEPHVQEALVMVRQQPAASAMDLPAQTGHRMLAAPLDTTGTWTVLVEVEGGHGRTTAERELFALLTSHLAQVLAKARDYEQSRTVALTLQHAILSPTHLPAGFAVRYTPAVAPLQVGGDWYDVVELPDGRVGVLVGDCVGRGLTAAAVMGQLRSASQVALMRAEGPAQTLTALDQFARRVPGAACTTVFCAIIDPAAQTVTYSSAGHLPAVLVGPGAAHTLLDQALHLPLAVFAHPQERSEATIRVPAGATLMLYTDGLIERRGHDLDCGIAAAAQALNEGAELHPETLVEHVIVELEPGSGFEDDVAVLLYRHPPAPLQFSLPALPHCLATVRRHLRRWLPAAAASPEQVSDILIAVGEAAANAIEHSSSTEFRLHAAASSAAVTFSVADSGPWRHPVERKSYRGNGIPLMRALMDSVDIVSGETGTTVTMTKALLGTA